MLARRLRRRPNIKSALVQRIVFSGSRHTAGARSCHVLFCLVTLVPGATTVHQQ